MGGDGVSKILSRRLPPEQAAAAGEESAPASESAIAKVA
jgi:hypothetical protein